MLEREFDRSTSSASPSQSRTTHPHTPASSHFTSYGAPPIPHSPPLLPPYRFGGGVLECDVWGHLSGAPVVMLHGGGQTRHSWNKTAAALAAIPLPRMHAKEGGGGGRFCVLTLDQKGHGGSYWDARAKKGQAFTAYVSAL